VTEVQFVTSIGTYLDAPFHFDPDGDDISQLALDNLVLPGQVLDLRGVACADEPLSDDVLHDRQLAGAAVLLCTGWDRWWMDDTYYRPPFASRALAQRLQALRPSLVGIDALMIDSANDPTRPAHTLLLRSGIVIVENLCRLDLLVGKRFTFAAVPAKVAGAAAFPVRAFAMIEGAPE